MYKYIWVTLLSIFLFNASLAAAENKEKKYVLLINSYSKGYTWTDNVVKGIEDILSENKNNILKIEYMDTKVINTPDYYQLLCDLYAKKYSKDMFDLIITTDDDAFRFAKQYREDLFPDVPVVFCGVNNFKPEKTHGFSKFTGVNEAADFTANLKLIFALHPKTKKVYVINDKMTTAALLQQEFNEAALPFQDSREFIYLDDLPLSELQKRLADVPKHSVIFYLSFFKDITGKAYTPAEVLPVLSQLTTAPMYGAVDYMLELGIIGGMLKSSYFQGETAAKLARQILNGVAVTTIPVVTKSPNQYMFDFRQLQRHNISMSELPVGSIITNEPVTFYYKYKNLIWSIVAIFTTLLGFIVVLLFNIKKRKRAQRGLQTIITMASSIVDYQSLESFKAALIEQLRELLPIKETPLLLKYTTENDKQGEQRDISSMSNQDQESIHNLPEQATKLIDNALNERRCAVNQKHGVALFKSEYLPGNVIYLEGTKGLDDLDRDLLEIFANNVTMSIENIEKHKIEKSLETAKQIQMSMLPTTFKEFSQKHSIDLHAFLTPAKEVGGDLYDFFSIDSENLCFLVGDVSDKGVPAALFMAMAKSLIRSAAENNTCPDQIITKANNQLSKNNEQFMFVTVFLAVYNLKTRKLSYTSAGHNPPYIVSTNSKVRMLKPSPGIVLGAFKEAPYLTETMELRIGESLYIYSDGVTEAMNINKELFGEKRLETALAKHHNATSEEMNQGIMTELDNFVLNAPQSDDISMLYVQF